MEKTETHDLGHGWFANFSQTADGETLTVRNPDIGVRTTLGADSLLTLRKIMKEHEKGGAK